MLKATRDALFLSTFEVQRLPWMMIVAAAVSVVGVVAMSRLMTAYSPARVLPLSLGLSAALLVVEWALAYRAPRAVAIGTFLHVAVFGATLISAFWSLVDESFDPQTAKRSVASIAGGGTVGGLIGGLLAWQLGPNTSVRTMLMAAAVVHVVAAFALLPLHGRRAPVEEPHPESCAHAGDGYLASLAVLVTIVAMSEAIMDYLLGAHASATFGRSTSLLSFFAVFHAVTGVLTLIVQALFTRGVLHRLGVAGSVGVLPLAVLVSTAFTALGSFGAVILRGGAAVISRSLYRSAYELLFTPLPDARRRAWKTFIDVGFERFGAALGGLALVVALAVVPTAATTAAIVALIALSVVALALVRKLHLGYVASLGGRLRASVAISEDLTRADRDEVLDGIDELPPHSRDSVLEATKILRSGSRERIEALLARERSLDPALIPHVLELLEADDLAEVATAALQRGFERGVGQLVDALLDAEVPIIVRRRVARALRTSTAQRALDGLVDALADDRFEVRYESGRSMVEMLQRTPSLTVSRDRMLAAVQNEIAIDRAAWDARGQMSSPRMRQSLDHVFTLLSFVHGDELVRVASRALGTRDRELRGTALEYLETVLPEATRAELWPYVAVDRRSLV